MLSIQHYCKYNVILVLSDGVLEASFFALHLWHTDVTELLFNKLLSLKLHCKHRRHTVNTLTTASTTSTTRQTIYTTSVKTQNTYCQYYNLDYSLNLE